MLCNLSCIKVRLLYIFRNGVNRLKLLKSKYEDASCRFVLRQLLQCCFYTEPEGGIEISLVIIEERIFSFVKEELTLRDMLLFSVCTHLRDLL
jgi:hypothetical protein